MKRISLLIGAAVCSLMAAAQSISVPLHANWQFRKAGDSQWYKAEVPGTVHTDLLANKLIPDPFYRDNESKVQWVENEDWEYRTTFSVAPAMLQKKNITIVFDGLDTYADVLLNGRQIIRADNMFRQWTSDIKPLLKPAGNTLVVKFASAIRIGKAMKAKEAIPHPENERIYVRKAQYQFGWDWGPRLVTAGIWKDVRLSAFDAEPAAPKATATRWDVRLVTKRDSLGEAFYFTRKGQPTYIRGANWIPAESFLPRAKKLRLYEKLIKQAREANINMLRVWGGGAYEDDLFYELCDRYGIMVWQDFMFAGAMYPGDTAFLNNVAEEVRYQVKRLRHHPSIVLWCGNNEIDEAWHNWGWQKQFGYSAADSARIWNDYRKLFHDIIPGILKELDPQRPYWSSSPSLGWGRDSAYRKGDVHYWGVWWGKAPVEMYHVKVGRFMSEYGMQGMPDMKTIRQFAIREDQDTASAALRTHQKHPFGYQNIKEYTLRKFRNPNSFENLVYVSQLMQADAIRTAVWAHRGSKPYNMGTLVWQWNDCWPVTSWSAVDYYGRKKALYYQMKRDFEEVAILPFAGREEFRIRVANDGAAPLVAVIETDLIHFEKGLQATTTAANRAEIGTGAAYSLALKRNVAGEDIANSCLRFRLVKDGRTIARNYLFLADPKDLNLPRAMISWKIIGNNTLELQSDKFAYGVFVDVPDGTEPADNYFHLLPGEKKTIKLSTSLPAETLKKQIKVTSLIDTYSL